MKQKIMLMDGHSILNRAFYGMPDFTNRNGVHTGAVLGFFNILYKYLEESEINKTFSFDNLLIFYNRTYFFSTIFLKFYPAELAP